MSKLSTWASPTRAAGYLLAGLADVSEETARVALEHGLDAVSDAGDRARIATAARLSGVVLPEMKHAA